MDLEIKAVMTRQDGSKLYREEHGFYGMSQEQHDAVTAGLNKHLAHLRQLEKDQKKKPSEVVTAVLSSTGQPDETFVGMTFDTFQKAMRAWGKLGDDLLMALEKELDKA